MPKPKHSSELSSLALSVLLNSCYTGFIWTWLESKWGIFTPWSLTNLPNWYIHPTRQCTLPPSHPSSHQSTVQTAQWHTPTLKPFQWPPPSHYQVLDSDQSTDWANNSPAYPSTQPLTVHPPIDWKTRWTYWPALSTVTPICRNLLAHRLTPNPTTPRMCERERNVL